MQQNKIIELSNGQVTLKPFCSRKVYKKIQSTLTQGVDATGAGSGEKMLENFNKSNDVALKELVVSIIIDGDSKPVNEETFDEMDTLDVDLIMESINEMTSKKKENKEKSMIS